MAFKIKKKVGDKAKLKATGEVFTIVRKTRKGYDISDGYTEFGTFKPKEFKKEFE